MPTRQRIRQCEGVFVFLLLVGLAVGIEHLQMHSIAPPILADFWESGLHYWSFGSSSVVTDAYVRLTTKKVEARGYFWNRHPNHVESFVVNTTVQFKWRKSGWFADSTDGGLALWYTSATPRHMPTTFFGNVDAFDGIGIVLDHSDAISVLVNSGDPIHSLVASRKGSCQIKDLQNSKVTISLMYHAQDKQAIVYFNVWKHNEAPGVDVQCAVVQGVELPLRNYFGVTASNSEHAQAEHDVISIFVRPLRTADNAEEQQEEEEVGLHIFDHIRERKLQAEWNGRGDEPLSKERPVVDGDRDDTDKENGEAEPRKQRRGKDVVEDQGE